jgi:hypothetical protein
MTRCALVALFLLAGCASAEDANPGGERDLAAPADASDDLAAATPDDLARGGVGDGGLHVPPITCGGARHVVINELKTTGAPSVAGDEFVELYNPCVTPIDLDGSSLVYRSAAGTSDVLVLQLNQSIAPGGYYLVAGPNYSNGGTPDQTYGAGKFLDTGGGVGLRDAAQTLIDSVGYGNATNAFVEGAAAPAPPAGDSIARTPNGTDTDHNNSDFVVATTPTPRAAN